MLVEALLTAARARLVMVALDASLIEAARLLHTGTDLVVACDTEGKFTGVITKTDIVGKIAQGHRSDSVDLPSLVVSREVVLCRPSDNLADIWSLMKKRGFKNVPVIDEENRPIGVLNSNDVLQVQLDEAKYEDVALRDYVMGVGYR
jgi:CBS domain-containing protein